MLNTASPGNERNEMSRTSRNRSASSLSIGRRLARSRSSTCAVQTRRQTDFVGPVFGITMERRDAYDELANHTLVKTVRLIGTDAEAPLLDLMACIMIAVAAVVYVSLQFMPAPYGRYSSSYFGALIPAKFAWCIQESPAFLVPLYVYLRMNNGIPSLAQQVLIGLFMLHYFHRTFIYSALIQGGKPTPFTPFFLALIFCAYNGYMQSRAILRFRGPLPNTSDPIFIVGVALFFIGMFINIQSDYILRSLRSDGSRTYKIPYGGMFDYVTAANYFGEIVEWCGFALAAWQIQGLAFAIFTIANLVPRAIAHHEWYLSKFRGEYPPERSAVIPFII